MQTKQTLVAVVVGTLVALGGSAPAFAKGGSPQTHHCKLADGTMDMQKTKKECKAAKGSWAKDADTGTAAAAMPAAPATAAAPKAAAPAPAAPASTTTPATPAKN